MSALADLRPFVRLCQIFGMIPYTMKLNSETKSFHHFNFSFKNISTWWYFIAMVAQTFACIFTGVNILSYYRSDNFVDLHLPIVVALLHLASQLVFICIQLFKRGVLLRFHTLGRAIALIKKVDRHLMNIPECKHTVLKRTIIGFFSIISLIALGGFTSYSSSSSKKYNSIDKSIPKVLLICGAFIQYWMVLSVYFSFLFMHLSYYITSFYIRLLRFTLSKDLEFATATPDGLTPRMKKIQLIFNDLCRTVVELNHVFSYPALFIITAKLVTFLNGLFMILYEIIKPSANGISGGIGLTASVALRDLLMILIYITSADMPIHQVRQLREKLIWISNGHMQSDVDYRIEVISLMMMMEEDRIRLTGAKFFKIGIHLIPPLTASLITYLIILLQTQINTSYTIN